MKGTPKQIVAAHTVIARWKNELYDYYVKVRDAFDKAYDETLHERKSYFELSSKLQTYYLEYIDIINAYEDCHTILDIADERHAERKPPDRFLLKVQRKIKEYHHDTTRNTQNSP